jgi:hypothetical protein
LGILQKRLRWCGLGPDNLHIRASHHTTRVRIWGCQLYRFGIFCSFHKLLTDVSHMICVARQCEGASSHSMHADCDFFLSTYKIVCATLMDVGIDVRCSLFFDSLSTVISPLLAIVYIHPNHKDALMTSFRFLFRLVLRCDSKGWPDEPANGY